MVGAIRRHQQKQHAWWLPMMAESTASDATVFAA